MVSIRGEFDLATRAYLSDTIDRAARLDDGDVVVDLSGVTFMDASTIGAIVDAHNRLRARARSLSVRAPLPRARRLFDVCDLGFLIEDPPERPQAGAALKSWVAVPASDRAPDAGRPRSTPTPPGAPARTWAEGAVERAGATLRHRAPS
ncbi:MAG TPA: STAS domain-containing protein [Acidimicrobiales bacterium]|nr:STAS domain-containing protein [Acidimicrobiales bacterium]